MKFIKLFTYCTILCSVFLVSCNKADLEVTPEYPAEISETSAMVSISDFKPGKYTFNKTVTRGCLNKEDNNVVICERECMVMQINRNRTAVLTGGEQNFNNKGRYSITNDVITFEFQDLPRAITAEVIDEHTVNIMLGSLIGDINVGCEATSEFVREGGTTISNAVDL